MIQKQDTRLSLMSSQKKMRFRKISSQKFDPMGELFHDSAIQMQAFIAFAAQKFGINENTFYLCNVRTFVFGSKQAQFNASFYKAQQTCQRAIVPLRFVDST